MQLSSGYPFWLIRYGLEYDYPQLHDNLKTDVVIMGGGISGALSAHYLIEAGVNCVLLDGRSIGLGSTCASTSLLQYELDVPLRELQHRIGISSAVLSYKLCEQAIDKLGEIARKIGFKQFEFKQSLFFAAYKKDRPFIEEEFNLRKKHGFDVRLLDAQTIKTNFHFNSGCGILSSAGAQTNAYSFTHALLQYGIKQGLKVYDRSPVCRIRHSLKSVELELGNGVKINCKKLVYATGYESVSYIKKKIVDLHSTYAMCSDQGLADHDNFEKRVLLWNTANPYLYIGTTPDNRIMVGGRDEMFFDPVRRDRKLVLKTRQLAADFNKLFPSVPLRQEFSWCGTFGSTKDGLPFIGNYIKLPNSFFALGFGGNGITFSLIAAEILKDRIAGRSNKAGQLFAFGRK